MKVRSLVASAILHSVVLLGVFWFQLYALSDADKRVTATVILALIAVAGGFRGARYGRSAQGSYLTGVVVAGSLSTLVGLWFMWALTYPVGEPPPLRQYLASFLLKKANLLWVAGPTLAVTAASLVGVEVGIRIRRRFSGSTPARS